MKKSVNFRRKPRSASAADLLATFRRLGMSDEEIKEALLKKKAAQHGVQHNAGDHNHVFIGGVCECGESVTCHC